MYILYNYYNLTDASVGHETLIYSEYVHSNSYALCLDISFNVSPSSPDINTFVLLLK